MPKIKSPINEQEWLYNQRYNRDIQTEWAFKLKENPNWDAYTLKCFRNIRLKLLFPKGNLTEKQADWLAELYDKYSN